MNGEFVAHALAGAASIAAVAAIHAPLAYAAWRLAGNWFGARSPAERARDAFLAACVIWHCEVLLLGVAGALGWLGVSLLHYMLLAAILLIERRMHTVVSPRSVLDGAAAADKGGIGRAFAWAAVGAALFLAAGLALYRIAALPDPYDSLTYHLMLPARWLDAGRLEAVSTIFGDIAPTYTPAAVEEFFFGLMLPLGFDGLARIGQLPFLLAGAALVAALARGETADAAPAARARGIAAAAMYLFLPELLVQGTGSMVDVAAAAYFLGALHRLLRWRRSRAPRDAIFAGALAGLVAASRFTGPVYLLGLVPFLCARPNRDWLRGIACFLGALAVTGAYPYVRNWLWTGNPLYPLEIELGGRTLFDGLFDSGALSASRYHIAGVHTALQFLTSAWGYTGIAAAATGAVLPFLTFGKLSPSRFAAPALLLFALHFFVVPYNANMRFLFPCWALAVLALVAIPALERARPGVFLAIAAAFALEAILRLAGEFRAMSPAPAAANVSLAACALVAAGTAAGWRAAKLGARGRRTIATLAAAAALLGVAGAQAWRETHPREIDGRDLRFRGYAAAWAAVRGFPDRSRIAYAGANLPYPLRGGARRHDVFTVPLDGAEVRRLPHEQERGSDLAASAASVELAIERARPDRVRWLERVALARVDYLALYLPSSRRSRLPEEEWVERDPRRFERVAIDLPAEGPRLIIYRVRLDAAPENAAGGKR